MHQCRICSNNHNKETFLVREMFLGYREEFEYFECSGCGCIQISTVPGNLSKYYPPGYYAFSKTKDYFLKSYLKHHRALYALTGKNLIGKVLTGWFGSPLLMEWAKQWMRYAGVTMNAAILDVGSGNGYYLFDLHRIGFSNLTGIDPYIKGDEILAKNVSVLKKDIAEVQESFDFIMLHHSFEHVPDPRSMLQHAHRILSSGSYLLIRTPVADSFARRTYGTNWVGFDAPRHLTIHTPRSIEYLAAQTGFAVESVIYDSDEMQFWASEQYKMDVALQDPSSYFVNPRRSPFSMEDIRGFRARAADLNKSREGDAAAFYLRKL